MIRTQISLTAEQHEALQRLAAEQGVSMSSLIRRAVDRLVAESDRLAQVDRAIAGMGGFRSGHRDTADNHDAVLDEAFSA